MFFHLVLDEQGANPHPGHLAHAERLQSFKKALKELRKVAEKHSLRTIELPKVGFHFSEHEFSLAKMILKETFIDTETEIKFV
jgi:hypothetical protein